MPAARVKEGAQKFRGVLFVDFAGPAHGAEGKGGHTQSTVADVTLLHSSKLTGRTVTAYDVGS
ncbi:hypothetical protein GCM10011577_05020 [Pseudarthrobacter polychromogenes]|uniref:Uncharacterized protein n=1 Tax=Pseudarthrobacter polychromogenes TaxID=1676 RepID=A0ABQ1XA86_9MICC|nr:hypothetical protein GCM10011577_05020 [Pseudarthrobacter polychromogenes]